MGYKYDINYSKKPSITTLRSSIKKAVKRKATFIQLIWGENLIKIDQSPFNGRWLGSGWIGRNSGYELAQELNMQAGFDDRMGNPVQFLRDHVQIVHVK